MSLQISKSDARRAYVRHHFAPCADVRAAFARLRSVQFDPLAPAGCNHDLVLQSRVKGYKVGDWESLAYQERFLYDGWDKQASLVPYEGWPIRRLFHKVHREHFARIFDEHGHAVDAVLEEIRAKGPLLPREFTFQERKEEWKGSWYGPNVVKQTLKALWHTGQVMTADRKNGHHVYDLTERVVPSACYQAPEISDHEARLALFRERFLATGLLRPNAGAELWSYGALRDHRKECFPQLEAEGSIIAVEVEGVKAYATPEFLKLLDEPSLQQGVKFIAPLDQFLWDRKMIAHLFDFDYTWEVYVPEPKRKWGYYILPVLFEDAHIARIEFWSRDGELEIRQWHEEKGTRSKAFQDSLESALRDFMAYCGASKMTLAPAVQKSKSLPTSLRP